MELDGEVRLDAENLGRTGSIEEICAGGLAFAGGDEKREG